MKKFICFFLLIALCGTALTSCESEDPEEPVIDPVLVSQGLFVLNEGNYYNGINGSLSYLDYQSNTIANGLFEAANQRSLGGTPNDMVEALGRLYICCTDENRVEIAEAATGKSVTFVEVPQPRHICTSTFGVYVSSYDGTVYYISYDGKLLGQSRQVGACLEGIAADEHFVYVCNAYNPDYTYNTNVVKLDAKTLEKVGDITVACNPTDIRFCFDQLYVLSTGNYADVQSQIQSIGADDKVTYVCDATLMAVDDIDVYAVNSVTDWTTYETKTEYFKINARTGERSAIINDTDAREIFSPCGIAVDFGHQCFYISSYSPGASGYADYSGNGYIMQFGLDGKFIKRFEAGVGPTTMVPFGVWSLF